MNFYPALLITHELTLSREHSRCTPCYLKKCLYYSLAHDGYLATSNNHPTLGQGFWVLLVGLVEWRACFHHQRQKKARQVILVDPRQGQKGPRQGQNSCHKPLELSVGGSKKMYYPNTLLCQGFLAKCKAKGFTSFNSCGRSHMLTCQKTSHDWTVEAPDLKSGINRK